MDIQHLAATLNSNDIKNLNRYHILSIFSQHNWHINADDIQSGHLERYVTTNVENNIITTTTSKWVFFKDTVYSIVSDGRSEWLSLIEKVDATESAIDDIIKSNQANSKAVIESVIASYWTSTTLYVIARDIVHNKFNVSDLGVFYTASKIAGRYSNHARTLATNRIFRNRYDMLRYYDEHDDDFWCDILILDLIIDGQIGFNFIDDCENYSEYNYDNTPNEVIQEIIEESTVIIESINENTSNQDTEDYNHVDSEIPITESISGGMGAAYEPRETVELTNSTRIDVSYEPTPEPTRSSSYDSSPSYDSGSSSDSGGGSDD